MSSLRIAVTGSTGVVGGRVAELLAAQGHQVTGLTRRPRPMSDGISSVYADYDDLDSLRAALSGCEVLVFVSSDGEAAKMILHHQNVVRAALDARIESVVYLSGLDADPESPFCYAHTNGVTERLLADAGLEASLLRASIFTEFFLTFLRSARTTGALRLPMGGRGISLVSKEDVARCLAALAVAPTGAVHDITGPEALALPALAAITTQVWGEPIQPIEISASDFAVQLAEQEDPWWAYAYSSMFASVREGRWEAVSDEVVRLSGRPAVSLIDTLQRR